MIVDRLNCCTASNISVLRILSQLTENLAPKQGICDSEVPHFTRPSHCNHCPCYRYMEVLDKGKAAAVTIIAETRDKKSGQILFENQATLFIRGAGGFGGRRTGKGIL